MRPGARALAKKEGRTRYVTGVPCPQGHLCERMVSSGSCVECTAARGRRYTANGTLARYGREAYARDPQKFITRARLWRETHPDEQRAISQRRAEAVKLWHQANPEAILQHQTTYRMTESGAAARAANAEVRRLRMTIQVPAWADLDLISECYARAREATAVSGIQYVVDHIVPIDGEFVSGLHVENNLQVITAQKNSEKGDRYQS